MAAAEQVGGFDAFEFGDLERANRFDDLCERHAVGEHQRKVTLDGGEARQRLEATRGVRRFDAGDEGFELQFSDKNILAELEYVRDSLGELAGYADILR